MCIALKMFCAVFMYRWMRVVDISTHHPLTHLTSHPIKNPRQIVLQTAMSVADEGVRALDPPKPFPPPYLDEEESEGLINYPGASRLVVAVCYVCLWVGVDVGKHAGRIYRPPSPSSSSSHLSYFFLTQTTPTITPQS